MDQDAPPTPAAGHPRPQLRRPFTSLDGPWRFAWDTPDRWTDEIVVPFAPETPASGIGGPQRSPTCWYERTFTAPALGDGERLLLHFGAVDREADVWVDGHHVVHHEGGYTPFRADVTDAIGGARGAGGEHVVRVRAHDDPADLAAPRGKQDWHDEPHKIWYPRTTGIWQSVWLEVAGAVRIDALHWRPDVPDWSLGLEARIGGGAGGDRELALHVTLTHGERLLAREVHHVDPASGEVRRCIGLVDGGIDDVREELMWSPDHPNLIDARLELRDGRDGRDGTLLDRVDSYTAMRSVRVERGRFALNERPLQLRLVLDQGYWPRSGMTPPSLEAIEHDVALTQALGFNGVRKHQKIEDPRFLRVADERGLLVWAELPSAYRFTERAADRLTRTWLEAVERDRSHPCVVAWVPVNESWGVPDLPRSARQRDLVAALFHLVRALDGDRPVVGNDGWELDDHGDLICVHDYAGAETIAARFAGARTLDEVLEQDRPGRRLLLLEGARRRGRPVVLSEFGGIAFTPQDAEDATWGYDRVRSAEDLADTYTSLLAAVHAAGDLAGFCYTQLTDTYQEANGLLTADREPKAPLDALAAATRGKR
ncbi:sugar-binding domain-containing protein [Baekduia alba]|uniref:sugar-binding domain-containing protein n=1 Tax=Baekduia alba TaxID=2997333 RepID=UPI002341B676|nr:sugar-binding domain-containing protein [Baekduia alba]